MYVSKNRWHVSKISTVNLRKKISRLSCTRMVLQERLRLVHPIQQTPIWRYPTKPLQLASVGYFWASLLPQVRCMCRGHQRLAGCVQTSAERGEDTAVMARLESACRWGRLPRRPVARHSSRHLGHRSRPRCCHRP